MLGCAVLSMIMREFYDNLDLDLFVPSDAVNAVQEFCSTLVSRRCIALCLQAYILLAVVVNVFTSTHLVCVYANQTTRTRANVPMAAEGPLEREALVKYTGRGFEDVFAYNVLCSQNGRPRTLGDSECWEMRHSAGDEMDFCLHSWVDRVNTYNVDIEACTTRLSGCNFLMEPVLFNIFSSALRNAS